MSNLDFDDLCASGAAIHTKFLPATNTKPARVSAKAEGIGPRVIVSYDHGLNMYQNHANAARILCERLKWDGRWRGGTNNRGFSFVRVG